jgi:hypothetical protein
MTKYVDNAHLDIDGAIVFCKSITPKCEIPTERVKAMTPNKRALGYTQGIPDLELSADVPMPPGGHEVDLFSMWKDGTEFVAVINYSRAKMLTFTGCVITGIESPAEEGKGVDTKLTIMALDVFEG